MNTEDKKELQIKLEKFSHGDKTKMEITRLEADYLQKLVNEDWRK
jgi:hypothetical protein